MMKIKLTFYFLILFVLKGYTQDEDFTSKYILTKMVETTGHNVILTPTYKYNFSKFTFDKEQALYYKFSYRKLNNIGATPESISYSFKPHLITSIENFPVIKEGSPVGVIRLKFTGKTVFLRIDYDWGQSPYISSENYIDIPYLSSDPSNAAKLTKAIERLIEIYKAIEKADPFGS